MPQKKNIYIYIPGIYIYTLNYFKRVFSGRKTCAQVTGRGVASAINDCNYSHLAGGIITQMRSNVAVLYLHSRRLLTVVFVFVFVPVFGLVFVLVIAFVFIKKKKLKKARQL